MTSDCLNCGQPILFGNSLLNQVDFCNDTCYEEYLAKYPEFPKRGEKNRCMHCGSPDIEILKTEEKQLKAGNLLTDKDLVLRKITVESWDCHNCSGQGETLILGDKVEDSAAYKEPPALNLDEDENQNYSEPGRDSEDYFGIP